MLARSLTVFLLPFVVSVVKWVCVGCSQTISDETLSDATFEASEDNVMAILQRMHASTKKKETLQKRIPLLQQVA